MTLSPTVSRRAFTLVELLAVIAIIAILATIIISTVSSIRRKARQVQCNSNLRGVATACLLYSLDNKDRIVGEGSINANGDPDASPSRYWRCGLSGYLGDPRGVVENLHPSYLPAFPSTAISPACLADPAFVEANRHPAYTGFFQLTNYLQNTAAWGKGYRRLSDIPSVSRLAMLGVMGIDYIRDTKNYQLGNTPYLWDWAPERLETYGTGKTALAFFDGHIELVRNERALLTPRMNTP